MIARAVVALVFAAAVAAQTPRQPNVRIYGPVPGIVRLGESSQLTVHVDDANGAVSVVPPKVEGLDIRVGPPSTQSRMTITGGRREESHWTTIQVALRPHAVGKLLVPPFTIRVGTTESTSQPFTIETVKDIRGAERGYLRVVPSAKRVYAHEPLHVTIEAGVDAGLALVTGTLPGGHSGFDVELMVPWLRELPGTVTLSEPASTGGPMILVEGRWLSVRHAPRLPAGEKTFQQFTLERSFLPTRPGTIELAGAVSRFKVLTGPPRRGMFNERIDEPELFHVYANPISIEVLPLPEDGRPNEFTGAVGRFTLTADVDKRRVRVGTSVKLTLTIEGAGNLEFLDPPTLDGWKGFHRFGQTVRRDREKVEVVYDIAPLDASVTEIPPVTFAYFDTRPGEERYRTIATDAIPLVVEALPEGEVLAPLAESVRAAVTPGVDDIHDLPDFDGPPVVAAAPPSAGFAFGIAVAPWLVAGLAFVAWRRRSAVQADVTGRRRRGAGKRVHARLARGEAAVDVLLGYVADRLDVAEAAVVTPDLQRRLVDAGVDAALAGALAAAIETGVASRYGGGGGVDAEQVRALVARCEAGLGARGEVARVLVWWCAGVALAAGAVSAQGSGVGGGVDDGVAAYRRGDYAAAAAAFARAVERPDADARAFVGLGNAWYRLGRPAEALWAYLSARRAMPRDGELAVNVAMARRALELPPTDEPFLDAVRRVRDLATPIELCVVGGALHAVAAFAWFFVRRRGVRTFVVVVAGLPALLVTLELAWFRPSRPPLGVVVAPKAEVVAEPRDGLPALWTLRAGALVDVLGDGGAFTRVSVEGRRGYLPAGSVRVVK